MALSVTTFICPVHDGNTVVPHKEWRCLKHFFHLSVKKDVSLTLRI